MLFVTDIGFTGTQRGMSRDQKASVRDFLRKCREEGATWFHHGDCIGADEEADAIAKSLGYEVALHPPKNPVKRAFCTASRYYPEAEYLIRNHRIVDVTGILLATPKTTLDELRSGTWATWRYAKKTGRTRVLVPPNGLFHYEGGHVEL